MSFVKYALYLVSITQKICHQNITSIYCKLLTKVYTIFISICISSGYVTVQVPTLYLGLSCVVRFPDIMSRILNVILPVRCCVCILVLSNLCYVCMSWILHYSCCSISLWLYTSTQVSLVIETRPSAGTPRVHVSQSRVLWSYCLSESSSLSLAKCDPPHLCVIKIPLTNICLISYQYLCRKSPGNT